LDALFPHLPSVRTPQEAAMSITVALLRAADSSNSEAYYGSIVGAMADLAQVYAIDTPRRIAHFLAQIGHESRFQVIQENGSYSATRMRQIFGCRGGSRNYDASLDDCTKGRLRDRLWSEEARYAHNPPNLLNFVYALRLGNGDEASGDGFRYRGRGMMQLTGKDNYRAFTAVHNQRNPGDQRDFVADPDLLINEARYGIESAFFFWDSRNLNQIADQDDVALVTLKVNGGDIGLADRTARLNSIKAALAIV
jgi:predicted chitinase